MPQRGFPSLTSGGRTPSYHTHQHFPSDYPAATVTGGRALPNSLAALSRIRWPTRAEICRGYGIWPERPHNPKVAGSNPAPATK